MASEFLMKLNNISYQKDGDMIADNISLDIKENNFLSFLMPFKRDNTFEKILSGIIKPDKGSIELANNIKVFSIFNDLGLFDDLDVYDNIIYPIKKKIKDEVILQKKVERVLKKVELDNYQDKKVRTLFLEEQIKVAIARLLICDVNIIVFDDILSNLSYSVRSQMHVFLKKMQEKLGITFIYVTANRDDAFSLSKEIACFYQGRIYQLDTPENLYYHPNSEAIAKLTGDVNVINARVSSSTKKGITLKVRRDYFDLNNVYLSSGEKLTILIRPENVRFVKKTSKRLLTAKIESFVFMGQFIKINARFGNNIVTSVIINNEKLPAINEKVFVDFNYTDVIILKRNKNEKN